MHFKKTILCVSIAAAVATLSGCGGGGGGSGVLGPSYSTPASTPTPTPNVAPTLNPVPFHTPTRVGSIEPLSGTGTGNYATSEIYTQDLGGSAGQEIIVAGRMTPNNDPSSWRNYNLSVFGWSNGQMVDQTAQWFPGGINQIVGTEPSVKFADFNNDGKMDIYVAPNTDTAIYGPGVVYINNGSSFSRRNLNLGNTAGHDSAIYDINRDGFADIFTLDFTPAAKISFNNGDGTFTTYTNITSVGAGAGVAVADFMGNGTATIITTDDGPGVNRLLSWRITSQLGYPNLYLDEIAVLPTPRFLLPKWSSYNFSGNHDVRALAFDFDNSGRIGAVITSRPWVTNGSWPGYSEVQFLKNQGNGVFVDVTDNVLIGYDHTRVPVSYNPTLMDVNNDGLTDIVLGGGQNAAVLIHTQEHKYVTSYANVLRAFQDQAADLERAIHSSIDRGDNNIMFVQGPDGTMYLVTTVTYYNNNTINKAVYLSKLGNNAVSAAATATAVRQTWPWMSDAQVNAVLAQSSTTWFGLNVLDPNRVFLPIGELKIPGLGKMLGINGSISGIALDNYANHIKALDSLGRDFNINLNSSAMPMMNMFSRSIDSIDDDTRGAQLGAMPMYRHNGIKFGGTEDNKNMVVGITGIKVAQNTLLSAQFTRLPFSPFVQLNGSWGLVKSSSTIETTVNYRNQGWTAKTGLMYSGTDIESGLVTRINPITSVWGEAGYEWSNLRVFGGMLPKVVAGSADLSLPTAIDNQGRVQYTNTRANVYGATVHYARFSYTDRINRNISYRINGMLTTVNRHSIIGELRFNF